jgi:DNA polymerase-3 subunit beta
LKFSVDNRVLADDLALASRSASSGGGNPILSGILVTLENGLVSFSATDGNRSIRVPVHLDGQPEGEGRALVPARVFSDISRLLGSGSTDIEFRSTERDLELNSGNSNFHIKTMAMEDFPPLPKAEGEKASIPREALLETVELVARAASRDDMRPVLTSVQMLVEGEELTMVATDSYRLAVKQTKLSKGVGTEIDRNIPAEALKELARLMTSSENENVNLTLTDREVIFEVDEIALSTTIVDGQFPNYHQLFPTEYEHDVRVPKSELLDSVKRVSQMAQKNRPLKLHFAPGELTISAETPDLGDAEEKMPVNFEGEELAIGFNHEYFQDGIDSIAGDELMLRLISSLRPGLLQPVDSESYRYLLMPIRLED